VSTSPLLRCVALSGGRVRVVNASEATLLEVRRYFDAGPSEAELVPPGKGAVINERDEVFLHERRPAPATASEPISADALIALEGLHRWLHTPGEGGHGALIEAAGPFHDAQSVAACQRMEREVGSSFRAGYAIRPGQRSTFERVRLALSLCAGLEPNLDDPLHCAVHRIRGLLAGFDDEPGTAPGGPADDAELALAHAAGLMARLIADDEGRLERGDEGTLSPHHRELMDGWLNRPAVARARAAAKVEPSDALLQLPGATELDRPPPMEPLPQAFVAAIVAMPIPSGPDPELGGHFIHWAMRGATMAWHARQCHPGEVGWIARRASSELAEPDREAWLAGYRLVVPEATPAAPVVPFELNESHRSYYWRALVYRAPEQLSALDREIVAAVDAEHGAKKEVH
jgi:hypothetical protein